MPEEERMESSLAERLRRVRGNIPQIEIAQRLGIHKSSWGRFERGDSEPSGSDLGRICSTFGINPQWLLLCTGEMSNARMASEKQDLSRAEERIRILEEQLDITRTALRAMEKALGVLQASQGVPGKCWIRRDDA